MNYYFFVFIILLGISARQFISAAFAAETAKSEPNSMAKQLGIIESLLISADETAAAIAAIMSPSNAELIENRFRMLKPYLFIAFCITLTDSLKFSYGLNTDINVISSFEARPDQLLGKSDNPYDAQLISSGTKPIVPEFAPTARSSVSAGGSRLSKRHRNLSTGPKAVSDIDPVVSVKGRLGRDSADEYSIFTASRILRDQVLQINYALSSLRSVNSTVFRDQCIFALQGILSKVL